jgi:hypothetical protein
MSDNFVPYPEIDDPDFYDKIFKKKEFSKTMYKTSYRESKTEDLCKRGEFKMQNHQEFVRNFLSPETPYNGCLLFHGTGVGKTCSAIGTTEGLRDYVKNSGKIYILAPETIRPNFFKELYDPKREAVEKELHGLPGSYQCAGDSYYVKGKAESKQDQANKLIKKYYEFMGPGQFANFVDIELGAKLPQYLTRAKKTNPDGSPIDIGDYFSNSVIVVDEAHGIASDDRKILVETDEDEDDSEDMYDETYDAYDDQEISLDEDGQLINDRKVKRATSKRSLLKVLIDTIIPACHAKGNKIKIILLTATPMKDNVRELANLLELLNVNDNRITEDERKKLKKVFHKTMSRSDLDNPETVSFIRKLARGYISYVKGNNPITFPTGILPDPQYLYEPARDLYGNLKTMFSYRSSKDHELVDISESEYNVLLDNGEPLSFNLVKCPMSIYHFKCYVNQTNSKSGSDSGDIKTRMISNFVFPFIQGSSNINTFITDNNIPNINKTFGNTGFKSVFKKTLDKDKNATFQITSDIWELYGNFLSQNNPNYPLKIFSKKFSMFLDFVNSDPGGISYAYSEFINGGTVLAAFCLEANGFVRYSKNLKNYLDKNGLPVSNILSKYPQAHLLHPHKSDIVEPENYYRCALCGKIYNICREDNDKQLPAYRHEFSLSTYIIVAGSYGNVADIAEATDDNIYGQKIKVILGTKKTGQGVDLKWVRQIHILDPWHNNTRIYQAIGRGIRHCSHADLPSHMRTVTIYKYSSVPDDTGLQLDPGKKINYEDNVIVNGIDIGIKYKEYFTETIDEHMYKRVIRKDLLIKALERLCKEMAIDCELNKMRNYFPSFDKDYSRECDYSLCKYNCDGFLERIQYIRKIRRYNNGEWSIIDGEDDEKPIQSSDLIKNKFVMAKVSDNATNNQDIWDELKIRNMILTLENYEDMLVDIPLVDIDNSTYNIYFSLPQINRAVKLITKLYQTFGALSLDKIIYLVNKTDPNIEKQYIYMGIDKLIGNPPKIEPVTIIDKYGRSGYIIYHNGFYIYQPHELHDTKIPMQYRDKPLTVKERNFTMNILAPQKIKKVIDKSSEIDSGSIMAIIDDLRQLRPDTTLSFICTIYKKLNKLIPAEHKMLLENLISDIFDRELGDISMVDAHILEYYLKTGLLLFGNWHPDTGLHNIIDVIVDMKKSKAMSLTHFLTSNIGIRVFSYNQVKGWYWRNNEDSDIKYYIDTPPDKLVFPTAPGVNGRSRGLLKTYPRLNNLEETGIYTFMAVPTTFRTKERLITNGSQYINVLKQSVKDFQSNYPTKKEINSTKLKIVYEKLKVSKTTKSGAVALRNNLRGRVCESFRLVNAIETYQYLVDIMKRNYQSRILPFENVTEEDYRVLWTITNTKNCDNIENISIILDFYQIDGLKWYLTPIETEIYRPKT